MNPKPFVLRPLTTSVKFLIGFAILLLLGGLLGSSARWEWYASPLTGIALLIITWHVSAVMRVDEFGITYLHDVEALYLWEEIDDVMLSGTQPPFVYLRLREGTTPADATIPPRQLARLTRAVEEFGGRPVKTP